VPGLCRADVDLAVGAVPVRRSHIELLSSGAAFDAEPRTDARTRTVTIPPHVLPAGPRYPINQYHMDVWVGGAEMRRVRMSSAGSLIHAWLALNLGVLIYLMWGNGNSGLAEPLIWYEGCCFLLWRVWRGSRIAWTLLLVMNSLGLIVLLSGSLWPWALSVTLLMAVFATQLAILASPAVRRRLR
jgi:hypothetical protein